MMKISDARPGMSGRRNGALGLALVGSAAMLFVATTASAMTLDEAITVAVDSHPTVLVQKSAKAQAAREIDEAQARYRPSVDTRFATGFGAFNNNTTRNRATRGIGGKSGVRAWHNEARLDISQMLFDGFETENLVEAARYRHEVNKAQIRDAEEGIALRVIEAYLEVLRSREIVDLAMENVQAHIETADAVRRLFESEVGNQADVLQAESRLANAMDRLLEQKGALTEAEADFIEAVGVMPDKLELPDAPVDAIPVSLDEAITRALAGNPAGRAAEVAIEARRADAEAAEAPFMPRIDLEVSAAQEHNTAGVRSSGNSLQALAVMRFNLYRGGTDTAQLHRAREFVNQTMLESRQTARLIEEQIRVDWNELRTAEARLPQLEDRMLASTRVVEAYRQQFTETGQRTLLDLLDVENELFQSRVRLVEGEFEVLFAHYLILETIGGLLNAHGIMSQAYAEPMPPQQDPDLLLLGD